MSAPLLTVDEAAARLQVPSTWLANAARAKRVPSTRLGRYVRFTEEQVAQIVADAATATVPADGFGRTARSARKKAS